MGRLFGTDGVRGLYEKELTLQLAYALGRAGAQVLAENRRHKPVIVLGRDTRFSGPMLEEALVKGICSTGAKALLLGVVPTGGCIFDEVLQGGRGDCDLGFP